MTSPISQGAAERARNPWLGVELRHLAALAAVAREGSFRGAAEALGYVQSAVSQQIAYLEQVVGQRLIERDRRSVPAALTPAGELLLAHAERILSCFGAAKADLDALTPDRSATLRLGACESLAPGLLPLVLPRFTAELPGTRLELAEAPASALTARVEDGSLDAALVEAPPPRPPFDCLHLRRDSYLLLSAAGAPPPFLARMADLTALPLIDHPLMPAIEKRLHALGAEPDYVTSCDSRSALASVVAAGAGCAIVPGLSVSGEALTDRVTAAPLDDLVEPREICLLRHAERVHGKWVGRLVEAARDNR